MTKLSVLDLNNLSEQELQKLINQSKKQIKKLKTKKVTELNSKDADVVAVADAVRNLAKAKKVTPADALSAVAKNMRVGMTASRKPRSESPVKYRHPNDANKTWKGFGKRPLWLNEELKRGRKLEDFKI
ncbi:MAG: H-NS histone family protein [Methylophaga sp.]